MDARRLKLALIVFAMSAAIGWFAIDKILQIRKKTPIMSDILVESHMKGPDNQPIIFWRIKEEDRDAIAQLLDSGYSLETKGGFGATPIIAAALIDDWITVLLLLERGANAYAADRRGMTMTYLLTTSNVASDGKYGIARMRVREFLEFKYSRIVAYEPSKVKTMVAKNEWPPL